LVPGCSLLFDPNQPKEMPMHRASRPFLPRLRCIRAAAVVLPALSCLLSLAAPAFAQVWTEVGDAGPLPATAQTPAGSGALTTITGMLAFDADVDMYCIDVTDPANFNATLSCVVIQSTDLYLFDSTGKGLALAQICSAGSKTIGASFVTTAGTYYIAVAPYGALAYAGADLIWIPGSTFARAPDGPGAANVVTSWGGTPHADITAGYHINLSGVDFCSAPTPARPRTWGTLKSIYR
jgi:hypothetical protein